MFDRVQEWLESYLKWHAPKKLVSFSLTRLTQLEVGARRGEERNGKEKDRRFFPVSELQRTRINVAELKSY